MRKNACLGSRQCMKRAKALPALKTRRSICTSPPSSLCGSKRSATLQGVCLECHVVIRLLCMLWVVACQDSALRAYIPSFVLQRGFTQAPPCMWRLSIATAHSCKWKAVWLQKCMLATVIVDLLPSLAANHAVTRHELCCPMHWHTCCILLYDTDAMLTNMWLSFQEDGQASDPCITDFVPMQF